MHIEKPLATSSCFTTAVYTLFMRSADLRAIPEPLSVAWGPILRFWPPVLAPILNKWLRGRDLNPRPLGYEEFDTNARPFRSVTYSHLQ